MFIRAGFFSSKSESKGKKEEIYCKELASVIMETIKSKICNTDVLV